MTADLHRPRSLVELALAEALSDPADDGLTEEWDADDGWEDLFDQDPLDQDLFDDDLVDEDPLDDGPPSATLLAAFAAVDRLAARWRHEAARRGADEVERSSAVQRARFRRALGHSS